jgi:VanZ family protein
MRKFLRVHGPTIVYASLIFIVSSLHSLKSPDIGISFQDKIYHVLEYGVFGLLLQRSAEAWGGRTLKTTLFVFTFGVLYAASDEIHQLFVPGRQCDAFDFLSDSAGIAIGQGVFLFRKGFSRTDKKKL